MIRILASALVATVGFGMTDSVAQTAPRVHRLDTSLGPGAAPGARAARIGPSPGTIARPLPAAHPLPRGPEPLGPPTASSVEVAPSADQASETPPRPSLPDPGFDAMGLPTTSAAGTPAAESGDPKAQEPHRPEPGAEAVGLHAALTTGATAAPGASAAARPSAASGNPIAALPLESWSATQERPIFSPTRRPPAAAPEAVAEAPPPPPVEAPPPPPETPPLTLIGTVVGELRTVAVFLKSPERSVVRLRVGETDSGWTLRSVEPKSTILEKDAQQYTLALPAPGTISGTPGGVEGETTEVSELAEQEARPIAPQVSGLPDKQWLIRQRRGPRL